MFKVQSRKNCLVCGEPITQKRCRTYCSEKCRNKYFNLKYREEHKLWQRNRRGEYSPDKVMCLICEKWYVQVGSHITQRHGMTAREYREEYELPVKRGIIPLWFKKMKGDQAKENGTVNNLKKGKKFWYRDGDSRARINTFFKSRYAEVKKLSQEIYPHEI